MSSRSAIATYAAATYSAWASETGIAMTDTSAGIAYQIDLVMAALGADTGNTAAWQALTDYHVLRRLQTVISARSDFDATAIKAGRSQLFMHLQEMIADAASRAAAAGYPVTGAAAQAGPIYWSTDWIEPEPTA